jgi:hypothetical protein
VLLELMPARLATGGGSELRFPGQPNIVLTFSSSRRQALQPAEPSRQSYSIAAVNEFDRCS